jgi:hypothetical protein
LGVFCESHDIALFAPLLGLGRIAQYIAMKDQSPCDRMPLLPPHVDPNRIMQPESLNQIINAILDKRYSWACVLMNYLPERTYRRLDTAHRSAQALSTKKSAKMAS